MKISYIIPVYNVEKYIHQCVDSVLSQSLDDCEIILVNDGSPDRCPEICDEYANKYPDKIKTIHKTNGGLADARNAGMEYAKGEYIFFIDSDDYLIGDSVTELYKAAKEYSADVLQTSFYSIDESNGKINIEKPLFEGTNVLNHEGIETLICNANSKIITKFVWKNLYRRDYLNDKSIIFEKSLRRIEDSPFNMQAYCAAERVVFVDIPVYCYRVRDGSLQRQNYICDYDLVVQQQWELKIKYYEKYCTPNKLFYEDLAEYTIKSMLPSLLLNIYRNDVENRRYLLKRISESEMMRRSFDDYDINRFKSKSLDWVMTKALKERKYLIADFICRKVLYKK